MRFGAHMSTSGGVWKALERGTQISCEVIQVFVKNNMQWFGKTYQPLDIARYRAQLAQCTFRCVFGHTGYLINLAAPPSDNRDKSIKSLVQEIQLATDINLPFLVLHPGAHLGAGEEAGLKLVAAGLNEVLRITKTSGVRVALENTAGQGSCLGSKLQHLAAIYDQVDHPERLAVCLDTAHFLAAGYDIRSGRGWDAAINELDGLIGRDQIVAFHLNDSKTDLGSRVDRHAHIGQGKIGIEGFRYIVNDGRFVNHPGCLETPKSDDQHEDIENLKVLRSLLASAPKTKPRGKTAAKAKSLSPSRPRRSLSTPSKKQQHLSSGK